MCVVDSSLFSFVLTFFFCVFSFGRVVLTRPTPFSTAAERQISAFSIMNVTDHNMIAWHAYRIIAEHLAIKKGYTRSDDSYIAHQATQQTSQQQGGAQYQPQQQQQQQQPQPYQSIGGGPQFGSYHNPFGVQQPQQEQKTQQPYYGAAQQQQQQARQPMQSQHTMAAPPVMRQMIGQQQQQQQLYQANQVGQPSNRSFPVGGPMRGSMPVDAQSQLAETCLAAVVQLSKSQMYESSGVPTAVSQADMTCG